MGALIALSHTERAKEDHVTIDERQNDWKAKLLTAEPPQVFNVWTDAADGASVFTFQDRWSPSYNRQKIYIYIKPHFTCTFLTPIQHSPAPRGAHFSTHCQFSAEKVRRGGAKAKQIKQTGTCSHPEGLFVVWICNRKTLTQFTWR